MSEQQNTPPINPTAATAEPKAAKAKAAKKLVPRPAAAEPAAPVMPAATAAAVAPAAKPKKIKLVRDSYAMPETEYARIGELKKRLLGMGSEAKKSELLRAGVALLAALNDAELKAVMGRVERIKTGRPN